MPSEPRPPHSGVLMGGRRGRNKGERERSPLAVPAAAVPPAAVPPAAVVRVDGEGLIARLSEELKSGSRPSSTVFDSEPILESVFAHVIREFLLRNDQVSRLRSRSGSGSRSGSRSGASPPFASPGPGRAGGKARGPPPRVRRGGGFASVEKELGEVAEEIVHETPVDSRSRTACLARFHQLRTLGAGEYGYTYEFLDEAGVVGAGKGGKGGKGGEGGKGGKGGRYALKTVFFTPLSRPAKYNNLVNEIRIAREMGRLGVGPRVYNVYHCEEDGGMLVMMVMELMRHGDIEQFSRTHAVTDGHMKEIERQLQRMHDAGYAHNDIHSGNIMVTEEGGKASFRLGDFGMSKAADPDAMRRDRDGLRHLVSYVNRDHLRAVLYDLVRRGSVEVSIDMRYTGSAQLPDFSYLLRNADVSIGRRLRHSEGAERRTGGPEKRGAGGSGGSGGEGGRGPTGQSARHSAPPAGPAGPP